MKNTTPTQTLLSALSLLALGSVGISTAQAAVRTWTGLGGNDTFSNSANWGTLPISGTDSVTFSGNTRTTPDLTAGYTAFNTTTTSTTGAVLFASGASSFTIGSSNGSTLTLGSTVASGFYSGINNASANTQTINTNITVTSSGARAWIGSTGGGNLTLGGTLTATAGIDFSSSSAATTTVAAVSGAGAINVNASNGSALGTTVLTSATGYTGTVTVNAGNLVLGSDLGGVGGTTITLAGGGATASALYLKNGVTLDNAISINPTTSAVTKTLGMAAGETGSATFSGAVTNASASTTRLQLTADTGATATFSGVVDFTRPVEKIGNGTVILSNTNTNAGGLKISAGTISVSADRNMGAVANTVELAGGTLAFTNSSALTTDAARGLNVSANSGINLGPNQNVTWAGNLTGSGNLSITGTTSLKNLILTGTNSGYTGSYTVGSFARLQVANGKINSSNNVTLANDGTLVVNVGGTTTIGTLSGGTTAGAIQAQASAGNATLVVTQGTDANVGAVFKDNTGILSLTKDGAARLTLTANNTYTGTTTIAAGTLQVGAGTDNGSSIASSSNIVNNGALVYNVGAGNRTYGNVISGTGSLTQSGTGTLTLSGANTYNGTTTINAGTLQIGSGTDAGSIASTSSITNNGALVYNVGSGTRTLGAVISGNGSLTQNSAGGTLSLSANNTYTGGTTVSAGTLLVTNTTGSGTGSGDVSVSNGATLGGTGTVAGNVALNGATIGSPSSLLTLGGNLTTTGTSNVASTSTVNVGGAINVNSGTFTVSGTLGGSGIVNVANGAALAGTATLGATTLAGGTLGSNGNTLTLSSTLDATGNNSIGTGATVNVAGTTTISSGVFSVNGTLGGTGAKIIQNGASLKGGGIINGATTFQGGSTLAPGNSPGVISFTGDLSLSGYTEIEVLGTIRGNPTTGYDGINLTTGTGQALTYGGTLTMSFNAPVSAGVYDIFALADGVYQSGTFGVVSIGGTAIASTGTVSITGSGWSTTMTEISSGPTWNLVFDNASGDLTVTAIPEPSTYGAFAGLCMVGFAAWRRRRTATKAA